MMNRIFSLSLLTLITVSAQASIEQAPPNFPYADGTAVFVDFETANYRITYDLEAKTARVESEITFEAPARGYPIFDLIPMPTGVRMDDRAVDVDQIKDPDQASTFRVIKSIVSPGRHRLTLAHTITTNTVFRASGVASGFWMSDLSDRQYLEQYLPTNFEFDAYSMTLRVEIQNAGQIAHVLRANGAVKEISPNIFQVEFPAFFTTSSVFFHLSPVSAFGSRSFSFRSVDGRDLPVEIYGKSSLDEYAAEARKVLAELERDYGAFPHAKVVIYGAGSGGMEYSGATMSSVWALGHELFHSYNARGVMPAQGNAGWIDEAISSWRDSEYAHSRSPGGTTKMAGHSVFTRMTDDAAYTYGRDFLAWIAGRLETSGKDLKGFLREYFITHFYQTVTTGQFRLALEKFSGMDLGVDFDRYIYGKELRGESSGSTWPRTSQNGLDVIGNPVPEKSELENPFHPKLSPQALIDLL